MTMDVKQSNAADQKKTMVSVCIANYNGESLLADCIDSVLKQNFRHSVEIIVHDDASTDNSIEIIEKKYPEVTLIQSRENVGFCVSNNRMVASAHGEFILLLNNDALLHPDALSQLYRYSIQHGYGIYGLPQYDVQTGRLIDRGSIFDPFLNPVPNKDPKRHEVGMIIGACLWVPQKVWHELGGFPELFGSIAEDMYICCLARLKNYPVSVLLSSGFDHWVGRSFGGGKIKNKTLSTTIKRRALSERNKTFVMVICFPALSVWLMLPLHCFLLVLEGMLLSIIKREVNIWSTIYGYCLKELWNNKSYLWKLRRLVQSSRDPKNCRDFFSAFTPVPYKLNMLFKHGVPHLQ